MNFSNNSIEREIMNELKREVITESKRTQRLVDQLDALMFGELIGLGTASRMADCSPDFLIGLASDPDSTIKIYNQAGQVQDNADLDNPMFRTDEILSAKNWKKTKVA